MVTHASNVTGDFTDLAFVSAFAKKHGLTPVSYTHLDVYKRQVLADCDVVIDHVYHTKACQQAMMETFRTYCSIDLYGRLNVLSSTQIVFHARRIIASTK